jgi:hypothetical protein
MGEALTAPTIVCAEGAFLGRLRRLWNRRPLCRGPAGILARPKLDFRNPARRLLAG